MRVTRVALGGDSPVELIDDARRELIDNARKVLGVTDIEARLGLSGRDAAEPDPGADTAELRRRGTELLERSADVDVDAATHPAFDRILTQLSPDEARILRLLHTGGAQPAVDVKTWRPFDLGSRTVAPGLTMIARHAGAMRGERLPSYLNNLFRLGLIWFSREPIDDLDAYQVLEAQPPVIDAVKQIGRARILRRSIRLTPFGADFCETVLPATTGEFEAIAPSSRATAEVLEDSEP
jgi:hypothetical protein